MFIAMKNNISTPYIGLIGSNGSGKSTVCHYLKSKGFTILSLSDIVREEVKKTNQPLTRENLTQMGTTLKETQPAILAIKSIEKAASQTKIVFDSIRHPAEVTYLKEKGTFLIGIDSPIEVRYKRIKTRKDTTDHVDFDTFKQQCEREYDGKSSGQNIQACLALCDHHILNKGTLNDLYEQLDQINQENHLWTMNNHG